MQAPQPGGFIGQQYSAPPNVQGATEPVQVTCPSCKAVAMTHTEKEISTQQWIICIVCYFLCFPCTCSPCYFSQCYKTVHKCSHCQNHIGVSQ